jgi:hypothetical protein
MAYTGEFMDIFPNCGCQIESKEERKRKTIDL